MAGRIDQAPGAGPGVQVAVRRERVLGLADEGVDPGERPEPGRVEAKAVLVQGVAGRADIEVALELPAGEGARATAPGVGVDELAEAVVAEGLGQAAVCRVERRRGVAVEVGQAVAGRGADRDRRPIALGADRGVGRGGARDPDDRSADK